MNASENIEKEYERGRGDNKYSKETWRNKRHVVM